MYIYEMRMNPLIKDAIYPVNYMMKQAVAYVEEAYLVLEKSLKQLGYKRVNVYARGSSGSILGSMLIMKLMNDPHITDTNFHFIRKKADDCAAPRSIRYHATLIGADVANIVIDDFATTGDTLEHIMSEGELKVCHYLILQDCDGMSLENVVPFVQIKYLITNHGVSQHFNKEEHPYYEGVIEYHYRENELRELLDAFENPRRNSRLSIL